MCAVRVVMVVRRCVHAEAMGVVGSAMVRNRVVPQDAVFVWEMGLWGEMRGCGYYCEVASSQVLHRRELSLRFGGNEDHVGSSTLKRAAERAQACQGELLFSASFLRIVVCKLRLTSKRA